MDRAVPNRLLVATTRGVRALVVCVCFWWGGGEGVGMECVLRERERERETRKYIDTHTPYQPHTYVYICIFTRHPQRNTNPQHTPTATGLRGAVCARIQAPGPLASGRAAARLWPGAFQCRYVYIHMYIVNVYMCIFIYISYICTCVSR